VVALRVVYGEVGLWFEVKLDCRLTRRTECNGGAGLSGLWMKTKPQPDPRYVDSLPSGASSDAP
jgi:hypothetical protein